MASITEDPVAEEHELTRALGPWQLTALGIGAIIGTGIFVITGHAAASYAGPGVVISFVIAGFGCLFAGLCYAEYASMIPVAGSAYTYTYSTLGKFLAWIIGWNLVLEYLAASSVVAVGWSGYFTKLMGQMGIHLSDALVNAPIAMQKAMTTAGGCAPSDSGSLAMNFVPTGNVANFVAMAAILVITAILVVGIRASARFNTTMVIVKLSVVVLVIAFGLPLIHMSNLTPLIPPNTCAWGHFGWSGVLRATGVIFFAYIGFDAVSVAAQEARNPQRDMPIGILGSLAICTVLYILMSITMTGLAPYTKLNVAFPVFVAIDSAGPQLAWLGVAVNVAVVAGLAAVMLVLLLGQSRIFYAMAKDGLVPPLFSRIHPRFHTPYVGTIITGIFAAVLAAVVPLDILGELVSIGTLAAFVIVCFGIMVLRVRMPRAKRPFRTPFVWIVAPLGIIMCGAMMYWLPVDTWIRLAVWTLIGLVIYFGYSIRHAKPPRWHIVQEPAE
ncbi:MAG: amino acid permease [Proteobacteria bacterium]|nr:amino acid permease [Pseudomonadota bacterium]